MFFDVYERGRVVGYLKHDPSESLPWVAIGANHRIGEMKSRMEAEDAVINDFKYNH